MYRLNWNKWVLKFNFLAGTSRGVMTDREVVYLVLSDTFGKKGVGEVAPLNGLSLETFQEVQSMLPELVNKIEKSKDDYELLEVIKCYPSSIRFAMETALEALKSPSPFEPFVPNDELKPIKINGLVWMNNAEEMKKQALNKLNQGYECIKIKVGALDLDSEEKVLNFVRENCESVTIRIDANGAWDLKKALSILKRWEYLNIHSVEQPIYTEDWVLLRNLCQESAIPIALDEQLIGKYTFERKQDLLESINPAYLVLKPGLIGGFQDTEEWIKLANDRKMGWWITSALESNIGLNAIYRFTSKHLIDGQVHGLGTGNLYHNNWNSPLTVSEGYIRLDNEKKWSQPLDYIPN